MNRDWELDCAEATTQDVEALEEAGRQTYRERLRGKQKRKRRARLRRTRFWLLLATAAWVFVGLNWLAGTVFRSNNNMVAAFLQTKAVKQEGILEVTARYEGEYLDDFDKRQLIYAIAGKIGLTVSAEPGKEETETRCEVSYTKQSEAATTSIGVISMLREPTHYVYVRISLNHSFESVLGYKRLVEDVLPQLKCGEVSTTIQLVGTYDGYLTLDRRDKVTDEVLEALGGTVVYEHRQEDLYTVYAYTGLMDDYITVEGKRINLHIAMSKDEENYRTVMYLASPILPDTW